MLLSTEEPFGYVGTSPIGEQQQIRVESLSEYPQDVLPAQYQYRRGEDEQELDTAIQ